MTDSTKCKHSYDKSNKNCTRDDKSEFLEEREIAEEKTAATSEGSDATAQNADSHFSVGLSHFIESPDLGWVHVIGRQVDNIIYGKTDEYNDWDGLSGSKLLTVQVENGHNTHNYYRYAVNGDHTLDEITCGIEQDNEGEENCNKYSLDCILN